MPANPRPAPLILLLGLFLTSGATGLVYELVWTRELVFVFGGTTHAISTVLTAFMGGLGFGSYLAGRMTRRMSQPGLVYGGLEVAIGLYALAVPWLLEAVQPLYRAMYPHVQDQMGLLTAARFVIGFGIMVLPTTLMGATLPVLVRYVVLSGGRLGQSVGLLYGTNSSGAVLGTLLTGFLLIPWLGLTTSTVASATVNIVVGLVALMLLRLPANAAAGLRHDRHGSGVADDVAPLSRGLRRAVLITFALSGFAAMVYQVMWTRTLVMTIGSSTYSFTCILAAFILGLALGSVAVARFVDRWRNPALVIGVCVLAIGLSAILIAPLYGRLPLWVYDLVRTYGAGDYSRLLTLQFLLIIAITAVPTVLMGALFPLVTRAVTAGAEDAGAATGRAYGVNTIGTLLGSFTAGFILIRTEFGEALGIPFGVQQSLLYASLLNAVSGGVLVVLALTPASAAARRAGLALAGAAAACGLVWIPHQALGRWDLLLMNSGTFYGEASAPPSSFRERWVPLYYGEGVDLSVMVAHHRENPDSLTLTVNATVNASTGLDDMVTNLLLGHVPLLIAPQQKNVCLIGLGCGVTLGAIAQHPGVERIDAIEIAEEVIDAARQFKRFNHGICEPGADPGRLHMIHADGRNHLLLTEQRYDVIVSEPSHPWMAGVSNLFTREFFELCRGRLTDQGVVAVWLHGYRISTDSFKLVMRTLQSVFPFVTVWRMGTDDFLMVAGPTPFQTSAAEFLRRFNAPGVRADLYRVGLGRPEWVLDYYLTAGDGLAAWAGPGPLNLDDNALLEFSTPREMQLAQADQLLAAFRGQGGSIFDQVLTVDATVPAEQRLVQRTTAAQRSDELLRELRSEVAARRDPMATLARLRELYTLAPGNLRAYHFEQEIVEILQKEAPMLLQGRAYRDHERAWRSLPPPTVGNMHGDTTAAIGGRLRRSAAAFAGQKNWAAAAAQLDEAAELLPPEGPLAIERIEAHAQAGAVQRAAVLLREALAAGVLSAEQVAARPVLSGLETASTSQPP